MIRHFFLDKTNSIINKSEQNLGLNPILHVSYGGTLMRSLIHFDIENIKQLIDDKTFANVDKLRFTLKMTNCFSVDNSPYEKSLIRGLSETTTRAAWPGRPDLAMRNASRMLSASFETSLTK